MRRLIAAALAAILAWASAAAQAADATAWVTTGDRSRLLAPEDGLPFKAATTPAAPGTTAIEVDPARRYQAMVGFGAAVTDASAWLIEHRMTAAQRDALLRELFGRTEVDGRAGVGFGFTRLTIGASDFSLHPYSLDDLPPGAVDPSLAGFAIPPQAADVFAVVRAARAVNPQLAVMASPWSAPAWMKTGGALAGGTLEPGMEDVFSRYLLRYVDAAAAAGVPVFALTIQNEPHFEPKDYPGMKLSAAQRSEIIGRHLGPLIARRGLATQILEWDHNWDRPQEPLAVLADARARRHIAGVAWHCYDGNAQAQNLVHDAHPEVDAWFTECSGGAWKPDWAETLPWMVEQVIIGATRGWARGVLLWNLALDEADGPHSGGCNDCRGVVTIDSATGAVTRNLEYYALAHASRFVRAGARRIESTSGVDGVATVAFRNADDGGLVLIACNAGAAERHLRIADGGQAFEHRLPPHSVATYTWPALR